MLLLAVSLFGQDPSRRYRVDGRIQSSSGPLDRLRVEIADISSPAPLTQLMVHTDGSLQSIDLSAGTYEFRVLSPHGELLAKVLWQVPAARDIEIRLPGGTETAAGPVSVYRLSHKVPGKARKNWEKSAKAVREGKTEAARDLLDEAIEADPEFADALHARGVIALQSQDVPAAREFLTKAAALDDANAEYQADAAVATYLSEASPQAETMARTAIRMDPENPKAHYVLGLSLLRQGKRGEEVLRSLRAASPKYPRAVELLNRLTPAN
jgi:tetratricopeptide (TPR) repeat protein